MTNKYAVVFPGQGSQTVGMLAEVAAVHPEIQQTFTEAALMLGYDLWLMAQQGPATELDKTVHTQPILLTASVAMWRVIQARYGIQPAYFAGHSLGEYTALVCAEALTFADALTLVAARGQFMQEAVAEGAGAMAAIVGLDTAAVVAICRESVRADDEILSPANFNSIGQIVIAGHREAVLRAVTLAKERGAKLAVLIPVSVPSHCLLMQPAATRLATLLSTVTLQAPKIPVINNVEASHYSDVDAIRAGLVRQLSMPVRWVETIQALVASGVTHVIECGPGKVLTGLNKRIDKSLHLMPTADLASLAILGETIGDAPNVT